MCKIGLCDIQKMELKNWSAWRQTLVKWLIKSYTQVLVPWVFLLFILIFLVFLLFIFILVLTLGETSQTLKGNCESELKTIDPETKDFGFKFCHVTFFPVNKAVIRNSTWIHIPVLLFTNYVNLGSLFIYTVFQLSRREYYSGFTERNTAKVQPSSSHNTKQAAN